ncbi:MAG: hypothetical protein ACLVKN_02655 [Flavonifractor plautii]
MTIVEKTPRFLCLGSVGRQRSPVSIGCLPSNPTKRGGEEGSTRSAVWTKKKQILLRFPAPHAKLCPSWEKSGKLDWKIRAFQYTMKREQKSIVLSVESGEIQIFFIFS